VQRAVLRGTGMRPPRRTGPPPSRAARLELAFQALDVGLYEWDVGRGIVECDDHVFEVLGLAGERKASVAAWRERFHPDDLAAYDAALVAYFKSRSDRFEHELRCRTGDGNWCWVRQHGTAVRDDGGRVVSLVGVLGEVTAHRRHEAEARRQAQVLETTLEHIDQGITMVDRDLHTIALNRRFLELLDLPAERFARGFHMAEAFRFNAERGEYGPGDLDEQVRSRVEMAARFEPHAFERRRPDGRTIAIRGRPLPGGGFVSSYTDVTEQRRAEEALRRSEERYAMAIRASAAWIYEWDVAAGTLYLSDRPSTFFRLPSEEVTPANWVARIDADDLPAYHRAMLDHFRQLTPQVDREYRVADADGVKRWVHERAIALRDDGGLATRVFGAISDITPRKQAEEELRRARDQAEQSLAEQTAVRHVLEALSRSAFDLDAVLRTLIESTARLSRAEKAFIFRRDGDVFRLAVDVGASGEFRDFIQRNPVRLDAGSLVGRTALEGRTVHIEDAASDPRYRWAQSQKLGRFHTMLGVPIGREGNVIGVIALWKEHVEPFTPGQIALVSGFSTQARIAIENARLHQATKEALEQQTAVAEILSATAESPADTQPTLDAIVRSAARLFAPRTAGIVMHEGEQLVMHQMAGPLAAGERFEALRRMFPLPFDTAAYATARAIADGRVIEFADAQGTAVPAPGRRIAQEVGYRSLTLVPLLRHGRGIGLVVLLHPEPGQALTPHQLETVRTFAAQAVIAIDKVSLFHQIERQRRALEVANRHKSQFLASMSHELRTPLNAIIGFTRIVQRRTRQQIDRLQSENLEKILASAQHLLALINAVLDLAKIEAGRVDVVARELRLPALLEECLHTAEPLVDADAVALERGWDAATLPPLCADEEKLRQIVINLLSNACKFTPRGRIVLRAAAQAGRIEIAVDDTGIGIAPERIEAVFEEFEQADPARSVGGSGTGLGLTIARRLARLMGGDITARSVPGLGSTFTLTLPLADSAAAS